MTTAARKPLTFFERRFLSILLRTRHGEARELLKRRANYTRQLQEHKRSEKLLGKELEKEAIIYAQLMVNCWTRRRSAFLARSAHVSTDGQAVTNFKVVRVKFARIRTGPEQIWFQIKVGERTMFGQHRDMLPFGVDVGHLTDEDAIRELSFACQRKVQPWTDNPEKGAWVYVNRLEGVGGIPMTVAWEHMLPHYSGESSRGPIVLGSGEMRDLRVTTLADAFHILIAGSSGGGKSNMINSIICGLLRFTGPDELKLILIDPKRLELGMYESVPHLMMPPVYDTEQAVLVLEELMAEVEKRTRLMFNKAKELSEWNALYPDQAMPRIVVIVDEFAQLILMPEAGIARKAQTLIIQLVNMARSLGIHLILATQYPDKSVLKNSIKINMGLTIAARTQNQSQSIVIIGTGEAAKLPKVPGRMLCMSGTERFIVQTPLIRREDVTRSIAISKGKAEGFITVDGPDVVINRDQVIYHIADDLNGTLNPESVWRRFIPYGVPAADLKVFMAEVIKAGHYTTEERDFVVQEFNNGWRLVELTPKSAQKPTSETEATNPYPFDSEPAILRLTSKQPVQMLALPAPKASPTIIAPEPDRPSAELVKEFIDEKCNVGKRLEATSKELNEAYQTWCNAHSYQAQSPQHFGRVIKSLGFMRFQKGDGTRIWKGLSLSEHDASAVA